MFRLIFININGTSTDVYILKILENGYKKYKSVTLPKDIQLVDARFGNNNMLCTFSTSGKRPLMGISSWKIKMVKTSLLLFIKQGG